MESIRAMIKLKTKAACLSIAISMLFFSACGGDTTATTDAVTAAVTAGANLSAFTYHSATAYWANFGQAGVSLSGATSSSATGAAIASYSWEQISGSAVTFTSDTASQTVTFDIPAMTSILHASDQYRWQVLPVSNEDVELEFRLTATDTASNSGVTTFTVHLFDGGNQIRTTTGLPNVGVGEKNYISGPSLKAVSSGPASTAVTDWTWALAAPAGSASTLSAADTEIVSMTPDIAGTYTITYTSVTAATNGTITLTAYDYVGVGTIADETPDSGIGQCGTCHSGNTTEWEGTGHSSIFEQVIGYYKSYAPEPYCWECHTTGYDNSTTADNGGFYDLVQQEGYSFPSAGTTWSAFTTDEPTLTSLTNVQCESCHGPGSGHIGNTSNIAYSNWDSGICGSCHSQEVEWKVSSHNSTGVVSGAGRYQLTSWYSASCARCHSSGGFAQEAAGETVTAQSSSDYLVACQACHNPHSTAADTPSGATSVSGNDSTQLRFFGTVTMKDDAATQVSAGKAAVCYTCHDGFYAYNEVDCDSDENGTADALCLTVDQAATQYYRMPHANTQSFVLEGVGAVTAFSNSAYDFAVTENSWHQSSLFTLRTGSGNQDLSNDNNKCVTCHMGETPEDTDSTYRLVGGHTWKMKNGSTENLSACTSCHVGLATLDRTARADYDGDGTVEGVQEEVKGLLLALSTKLLALASTRVTGGTTQAADGTITVATVAYAGASGNTTAPETCATTATPTKFKACNMAALNIDLRRAIYDYNMIVNDLSLGIHNTAFAVQLLQKTYTAISQMNGGASFISDYPNAILR